MPGPHPTSRRQRYLTTARALQTALDDFLAEEGSDGPSNVVVPIQGVIRFLVDEGQLRSALDPDDQLLHTIERHRQLIPRVSSGLRADALLRSVACHNPEMETMSRACALHRVRYTRDSKVLVRKLRAVRTYTRVQFLRAHRGDAGTRGEEVADVQPLLGKAVAYYPMDLEGRYFSEHDDPEFVRQREDFPFHLAHAFAWARRCHAALLERHGEAECPWTGLTPEQLLGPGPEHLYLMVAQDWMDRCAGPRVSVRDHRLETSQLPRRRYERLLLQRMEAVGYKATPSRAMMRHLGDPSPAEAFAPPRLSDAELDAKLSALTLDDLPQPDPLPAPSDGFVPDPELTAKLRRTMGLPPEWTKDDKDN